MNAAPTRARVLKAVDVRQAVSLSAGLDAEVAAREAARADDLRTAYEQGVAAGREQAGREGAAAAVRGADALERAAAAAVVAADRELAGETAAVLQAALEIAQWVLRAELSADGRHLLARLEEAAAALLPSPTTRIAVSPADYALVTEWADRRARVGTEVVADARLTAGDAVVTTDAGRAEVTVAAALRTAAEALGLVDPVAAP